ncbi:MAG: ABC transporter substrate-binding protein [Firmicutes bacterium]|nr:ABC transporter substrate-binding protein [Bacillota bacterium]
MKKVIAVLMIVMMTIGLCACGGGSDDEMLKIGVIQLVKHDALDKTYQGFVDGLKELGYEDGVNIEIDYQNASGEQANCLSIAESMVNDNKDLIFCIATPAAQAAASKTNEIPILVSAVTDPAGSGLVASNEEPGCNVSGTSDLTPVEDQIKMIKEILPNAKKIAVLYASNESNSAIQVKMAKDAAKKVGLEVVEASVSNSNEVQQVVAALQGKVDAIYAPTDNTIAAAMPTVASAATPAGIPVICGEAGMVEAGGLATYALDYYNLGKMTAKQAVQVLVEGADIAKMPIGYANGDELKYAVNKALATQLKITIPSNIMNSATIFE